MCLKNIVPAKRKSRKGWKIFMRIRSSGKLVSPFASTKFLDAKGEPTNRGFNNGRPDFPIGKEVQSQIVFYVFKRKKDAERVLKESGDFARWLIVFPDQCEIRKVACREVLEEGVACCQPSFTCKYLTVLEG